MNRWYCLDVKTLDEAFGVRYQKGKHLAALRKKRRLDMLVFMDIQTLHRQGRPINKTLFAEIARKHGIGRTLCETYYRDVNEQRAQLWSKPEMQAVRALLEPHRMPRPRKVLQTRKIDKIPESRSQRG
jgi:hypothetical protein